MRKSNRIPITAEISIPLAELRFRFVHSSKPGGQHVNKAATQVELTFDVAHSPSLSDAHKRRILATLKNRIDRDGILRLESQSTRSQLRNRQDVLERFQALLRDALKPHTRRRATQPTAVSQERRLHKKKRRSAIKRARRAQEAE